MQPLSTPSRKEAQHVLFICKFPLRKFNVAFRSNTYPYQLCRNPLKDAAVLLKKHNLLPNDMVSFAVGKNPGPCVTCLQSTATFFNMQHSCRKVPYPFLLKRFSLACLMFY